MQLERLTLELTTPTKEKNNYVKCITFLTGSLLTRMVMSSRTSPMAMCFVFLAFC